MPGRQVLLLYPPYEYDISRYQLGNYTAIHAPPLGLGYLASALMDRGFGVDIVNMALEGMTPADANRLVGEARPMLVGISGHMAFHYLQSIEVARAIKQYNPNIPVVFGGTQATFLAKDTLHRHSEVDFVVLGEGEESICELAEFIASGANQQGATPPAGVAYRGTDGIGSRPRALASKLDAFPPPDRRLLQVRRYPDESKGVISTSRGCPHRWAFCSTASVFPGKIRRHSTRRVIEELEQMVGDFAI
ncbi:MAG: radical SAM protein, partial [Acidimicrobiales bacterium]